MKLTLYISLMATICIVISCSSSQKKDEIEKTKISIEPRKKEAPVENDESITKENLFAKLELVIEKKISFKSVSITYDELLSKFSESFKAKFTKDGGDVFRKFLPQWRNETEALLNDLNAKDIKVIDTTLELDKEDTELKGYSGTVQFSSNANLGSITLGFAAFEVNGTFYINFIRAYGN